MKRKIQKIISCIIVVCLTVGLLSLLSHLTERKDSQEKYRDFFEQEEDFDVLFFGSSHMMNAVYPMELWSDYGIVSYNMGGHASTLCLCYWMIQNALDYTTPEVVVIDCMGLSMDYLINNNFNYMHQSFDAFPLTKTKIQAVYDLVGDSKEGANDAESRQAELLWNFSTYHSRWSELEASDFSINASVEKGAQMRIGVATPDEMPYVSPDDKYEGSDLGKEYLIRAIEDCQARGIEVLLVYVPFPANEKRLLEVNAVYDIAEEYNVNYINFFDGNTVNLDTDCYDSNSHLNPSGAHKVTSYLGSYLKEHYGIADHRDDPDYAFWHDDYEAYYQFKLEQFISRTNAYHSLMMLSDDDYSFIMEVNRFDLENNSKYISLMQNLGIDPERITEEYSYVISDRASGTFQYISRAELETGAVETSLGTLSLESNDSEYTILLNGEACGTVAHEKQAGHDFRIVLLDLNGKQLAFSQQDIP